MQANVPFDQRLKAIVREHEKMSNGVVKTVSSDGLIVVRPRMFRPKFPLKTLIIVLSVSFLLKGFLLAYLGDATYSERLGVLETGTAVEQVGAWVMQPDAVTEIVAEGIASILPI